ncbi:DUF1996 domain-containing protein [Streptomyces iconiensis]|uniref:DUF1996 domain-containing protein n=1 Tax=Streptomyces iconiensis TaxID=1384038 RepID=A0ABT6ZVE4_9ACTN|nr:DUF1996 domain-containing protein [Streptomyces iconiensis]
MNATAGEEQRAPGKAPSTAAAASASGRTIDCPDVGLALGDVPREARHDVAAGLARLDHLVAGAYERLASGEAQSADGPDGPGGQQGAVLGELRERRAATIGEIADSLAAAGAAGPDRLARMSSCTVREGEGQSGLPDDRTRAKGGSGTGPVQRPQGPVPEDFVDITTVEPNVQEPAPGEDASTGTFTTRCGRNGEGHYNSDNVIAAPGVSNGAHHTHDYVGNLSTNAFSTNESLAAADSTCRDGDLSTYYWPVLRSLDGHEDQGRDGNEGEGEGNGDGEDGREGTSAVEKRGTGPGHRSGHTDGRTEGQPEGQQPDPQLSKGQRPEEQPGEQQPEEQRPGEQPPEGEQSGGQPGGADDGNVGSVLKPDEVTLTFAGSPVSEVAEMPRFLRIITGDAKSFTNGIANANASWSCEGFENRQLKDKYPLCPEGSKVVRTFHFQSCWDGANTDSGNHRDHVAFAREDGSCPDGFRAVPQLRQRITYDVPRGEGVPEDTPYAVDSFPEQLHKPVTDHGDFINVMPEPLMRRAVDCVNSGRTCG